MKPEMLPGAVALALLTAACGAGAVRPRFDPFPQAISDTVRARADSATLQIAELLLVEGFETQHVRPSEGYTETKWFDVAARRTASSLSLDTDSVVRLRFWVDPATVDESVVVGEAVTRRVLDPSLPDRATEEPVPQHHPANEIVRRILAGLKEHSTG